MFGQGDSYETIGRVFEHGLHLLRNDFRSDHLRSQGTDVYEKTRALIGLLRRKDDLDQHQLPLSGNLNLVD